MREEENIVTTVSVVLPFYNRRHTLERALQSVIEQSLSPLEIIAIDDASEDGGAAFIASNYPDVSLLQLTENKGVSAARNLGISKAKGDWIAFIDSDDEWLPDKLQAQFNALSQTPEMKVVHTDEIWIRNDVRVNAMNKHQKMGGYIFECCLPLCAISPSSVMIHRDVFEDVGYFDELLPACEDYDLWLRICLRYPVCYVDQPLLNKYGGHDDQLSRKYWGMDRFRIQALEKVLHDPLLKGQARDAVLSMLLKKTKIMLQGAKKRANTEMVATCESLISKYHV